MEVIFWNSIYCPFF